MTVENNFIFFHEYFYLSMCENNKEEKWFLFFLIKQINFITVLFPISFSLENLIINCRDEINRNFQYNLNFLTFLLLFTYISIYKFYLFTFINH